MHRAALLFLALAACGGHDTLSKADCERYADRMVDDGLLDEPELKGEIRARFVDGCLAGDVDREELDCVVAAKDDLALMDCESAAERRHPRRK